MGLLGDSVFHQIIISRFLPRRLAWGRPQRSFPRHVQRFRRPEICGCGTSANRWRRREYCPHPCWRSLLVRLNAEPSDGRSRAGYLGEKCIIVSKLPALETRREATVRLQPDFEGAGASSVGKRYLQSKINFSWRKPGPNSQKTESEQGKPFWKRPQVLFIVFWFEVGRPAQGNFRGSKTGDDQTSI